MQACWYAVCLWVGDRWIIGIIGAGIVGDAWLFLYVGVGRVGFLVNVNIGN